MRALTKINIDQIKLWNDVVSKKNLQNKDRLLKCRKMVEHRYKIYDYYFEYNKIINKIKWSKNNELKEKLQNCYSKNKIFVPIRKQIIEITSICPYCRINRVNTIDHFFDKSEYPEYSINTNNLVPCCSECNIAKGTKLFGNQNGRKFIHFYYDKIPNSKFLYVDISFKNNIDIPIIKLYLKFKSNNNITKIIENHFRELDLIKKYVDGIQHKIYVIISEIKKMKCKGMNSTQIIELLKNRYESNVENNGENYWETCLYYFIVNNRYFVEKIKIC